MVEKSSRTRRAKRRRNKPPARKDAEEPKSDKGPAIQERDKEAVIRIIEESEENRKFDERMSKGNEL